MTQAAAALHTPVHPQLQLAASVVNALRGEGLLIAPLVLSLIPSMREWPQGLQIELHSIHPGMGRLYGAPPAGDADPIHVRAFPDGSYRAAYPRDAEHDYWLDCGDHANSLFEAVLAALELRDGLEHRDFVSRLQGGAPHDMTDAQRLRIRLAEQIEAGHPPAMHVLETFTASQRVPRNRPVDGAILSEIFAMRPVEFDQAGGLPGLASRYRVPFYSLGKYVTPAGQPTAYGLQMLRRDVLRIPPNTITAPLLLDILKERGAAEPRTRAELAVHHNVSVDSLESLVEADWTLKAGGWELLEREDRGPTVPVTHGVLRTLADRVKHLGISTDFDLYDAAKEHRLCFSTLRALLKPRTGLTRKGETFLKTPWPPQRAALAIQAAQNAGLDTSGWDILTRAPDTRHGSKRARMPVTADLLLWIWEQGGTASVGRGGLRALAALHDVLFNVLAKHVYASGAPKALGVQLIREKYPKFVFDENNPAFPGWPRQVSGTSASRVPAADSPPGAATESPDAFGAELQALLAPDSPGLPDELMALREEDLLPLLPDDAFELPSKRPRP